MIKDRWGGIKQAGLNVDSPPIQPFWFLNR